MRRTDRSGRLAAAAAGAAVAALLVAVPLQAAPPPKDDVRVINTTAEPVPVAVQGTPPVTVANSAAQAVPTRNVDDPARTAVQRTALLIVAAGTKFGSTPMYTVPAGKRLVIETGSVQSMLHAGVTNAMVNIRTFLGGNIGAYYLPQEPHGFFDGQGTMFTGSQDLRVYADAGTNVDAVVTLNTGTGLGARLEVSFSGHLVDA
jgi:hypothetical protein